MHSDFIYLLLVFLLISSMFTNIIMMNFKIQRRNDVFIRDKSSIDRITGRGSNGKLFAIRIECTESNLQRSHKSVQLSFILRLNSCPVIFGFQRFTNRNQSVTNTTSDRTYFSDRYRYSRNLPKVVRLKTVVIE